MDKIDKTILNRIQSDFPINPEPYKVIADELSLTEDDVLSRVGDMRRSGIIRRIGGNFSPEKLGFTSTLCAARVPEDNVDSFAQTVNKFPGVTHNYIRENDYNVWFTFIEPSSDVIKEHLQSISQTSGVTDILNLPATHVFKIRAHFNL